MSKSFWKAALTRAFRTFCQNLASTIPAGVVVTPVMIQELNVSFLYVLLAWLATGLLAGVVALLTAVATGLPEVELDRVAKDNEACYVHQLQEANALREELYGGENDGEN